MHFKVKRSIDMFEETQKNQVQASPYQQYVRTCATISKSCSNNVHYKSACV